MINWDKPIETVDGRKAKLLSRGYWRNGETYCVIQVENPETGDSEISIIHPLTGNGYAAIAASNAVIRNVRVKREGWVLVEPKKNRTLNNIVAILGSFYVYPTEKEALRAIEYHNMDLETKAVFFQWEEEP